MRNTIIYLIRHADTLIEDGIRKTKEDSQMINEKEILSVDGEKQARKLSEYDELKNIDIIWSSSYCRAKETAKYIAYNNNLHINIDSSLDERKLGNLNEIALFMKDKKTRDPSQEQLLDRKFKTSNGESCEEVNNRMTQFLNKILKEYKENKIAIVSHGGTIKFLLLNWCEVNQEVKLVYKDTVLDITSPCCIKLEFNGEKLVALNQIM